MNAGWYYPDRLRKSFIVGASTMRSGRTSHLIYQTLEEFAAARACDKTQWLQPLALPHDSAPAPIAHAAE
jgi:hypothetical protein